MAEAAPWYTRPAQRGPIDLVDVNTGEVFAFDPAVDTFDDDVAARVLPQRIDDPAGPDSEVTNPVVGLYRRARAAGFEPIDAVVAAQTRLIRSQARVARDTRTLYAMRCTCRLDRYDACQCGALA